VDQGNGEDAESSSAVEASDRDQNKIGSLHAAFLPEEGAVCA
jgi:hypothetical protein